MCLLIDCDALSKWTDLHSATEIMANAVITVKLIYPLESDLMSDTKQQSALERPLCTSICQIGGQLPIHVVLVLLM